MALYDDGVSYGKMADMVDMYSSFDHVWQCSMSGTVDMGGGLSLGVTRHTCSHDKRTMCLMLSQWAKYKVRLEMTMVVNDEGVTAMEAPCHHECGPVVHQHQLTSNHT